MSVYRVVAQVEYYGLDSHGWQEQPDVLSVAQLTKEALYKLIQEDVKLGCAGRTDKGVHAVGQVMSFGTDRSLPDHRWKTGLNRYLPDFIRVVAVKVIDGHLNFHPRYQATSRRYRYYCYLGESPLLHGMVLPLRLVPSVERMNAACQALPGMHDFSSFRGGSCQARSPIKTCLQAHWSQHGKLLCFEITATGFLHHMVRYLVGSLLQVGYGVHDAQWFASLVHHQEKHSFCVPSDGLYFCHASYPVEYGLPFTDKAPWFDTFSIS